MKQSRILAATRVGKRMLGALALLPVLFASLPAGAQQAAQNVVGVYQFNSNQHTGIQLHITSQVPIAPHPNTGQPRARFEGFVTNGSGGEPVAGFVTGVWTSSATPVSISFSRALANGIVQSYQGAFGKNAAGRVLMAGVFSHPGAGSPFPWVATR